MPFFIFVGLAMLIAQFIKGAILILAPIVGIWLVWKILKYFFAPSIEIDDGEEEVLLLPPPSEEVQKELEAQAKKG